MRLLSPCNGYTSGVLFIGRIESIEGILKSLRVHSGDKSDLYKSSMKRRAHARLVPLPITVNDHATFLHSFLILPPSDFILDLSPSIMRAVHGQTDVVREGVRAWVNDRHLRTNWKR